jgi:hypothetical protein
MQIDYNTYKTEQYSFETFKTNTHYNAILEHVDEKIGNEYLTYIINEFVDTQIIQIQDVINFANINDTCGSPNMFFFNLVNFGIKNFYCSPTSLRYVYHALVILQYYKTTGLMKVVEVGCGYGGLFLAINFFSKILGISIQKYYIIDLPEILLLISQYLSKNSKYIHIPFELISAETFGKNIIDNQLFFISNYCFTEIHGSLRNNYIQLLFPKVSRGFITWQTTYETLDLINELTIPITKITIETPQTNNFNHKKNYFVYL